MACMCRRLPRKTRCAQRGHLTAAASGREIVKPVCLGGDEQTALGEYRLAEDRAEPAGRVFKTAPVVALIRYAPGVPDGGHW